MSRKALPSVLLHKSEVTYRDTGVSKNQDLGDILKLKTGSLVNFSVSYDTFHPQL